MTKYILHGGYERWDNELNGSFYREIGNELPEDSTLLLVYFAAEDEDLEPVFQAQSERILDIVGKSLKILLANEEHFLSQLESADAVHFRGGNTNKLLEILRRYGNLSDLLRSKKLVSGSSAGAYALAKYGTSHSESHIREGLGLVPVRLVCHDESLELPPSLESLSELLAGAPELELVRLKDCEWRVF